MPRGRKSPVWVPRLVVEALHADQIRTHGGLAGMRDEGALEAALARPRNRWAYESVPTLAELAASYAFGLARSHPFQDGNKRAAFLTLVVFLGLNGQDLSATEEDVVLHVLQLAAGELSEAALAAWIANHLTTFIEE